MMYVEQLLAKRLLACASTFSTVVGRTKLTTLTTIDMPWRFLKISSGFPNSISVFWRYSTVSYKPREAFVLKTSLIRSYEFDTACDRQT